jgi:hypothetical protein
MLTCMGVCLLQDTVQTVQALKGASAQMRGAMKHNKELDLNFIDNLQVRTTAHAMSALGWCSNRCATAGLSQQTCCSRRATSDVWQKIAAAGLQKQSTGSP